MTQGRHSSENNNTVHIPNDYNQNTYMEAEWKIATLFYL